MAHDVFISYSSHDKAVADATCAALEASGIRCWIAPRDVQPSAEWGEAIVQAIDHCRLMVLVFSANANASPQIRREVERAVSKAVPIIPLRIEDVAPAGSLEFFIGAIHWLDALTPPLESHLRQLGETVKALLQIEPAPPRITAAPALPASPPSSGRRPGIVIALALFAVAVVGIGVWRYRWAAPQATQPTPLASRAAQPVAAAPAATQPTPLVSIASPPSDAPPTATPPAPAPPPPSAVDPLVVGAFEHDGVLDGYNLRTLFTIGAQGTYRLVTTASEDGVYQSANGQYRTTATKTGRMRTGSYRAVGAAAIEVTSATGSAIYRPVQPGPPLDPKNPAMLGVWRASATLNGIVVTLTIDNSPNGAYHFESQWQDSGSCVYADHKWRATSAVSGLSQAGAYRIVDSRSVEIDGPTGSAIWTRQ
jgi:hypothetical protein